MRAAIAECRRRTVAAYPAARRRGVHARVRHRAELVGLQLVPGQLSQPHPGQHRSAGADGPRDRSRLPRRLSRPPRLQHAARARAGAGPRLGRIYGLSALFAAELHRRGLGQLRRRARLPRRRAARVRDGGSSTRSPACRPTAPTPISGCRRRSASWPAPASPSPAISSKAGSAATQAIALTQRYQLVSPRAGRAVDRLHRAVSRLCDQLRARRGHGADLCRIDGPRSGPALGGDGARSCPSRPCRATWSVP